MTSDILLIVGPTGSGKSAVGYELAQRLDGEIISADSMQIYRGVPLLTQQPPAAWQAAMPHHLVGTHALSDTWSAAQFRAEALRLIDDVRRRERLPIVVGGTGLYVRALLDGLCDAPAADANIRTRLMAEIAIEGGEAAHHRLAAVDPVAAHHIHPHDVRRIVRALEVYEVTREPLSRAWATQPRATFPHTFAMVGLDYPRVQLYDRINARVVRMFADGVADEVRVLEHQSLSHTAQQMLGLVLVRELLAGQRTVEETQMLLQQQTRQYAKRQLIWFRRDARIRWVDGAARAADIATHIIHTMPADA